MRGSLFLCLLLSVGCSTVMPGVVTDRDESCGEVRPGISVWLRGGLNDGPGLPLLGCDDALMMVDNEAGRLRGPWVFMFTSGMIGYDADAGRFYAGATFTSQRVIEVNVNNLNVIAHEVRHAYNYENGLPDHEDW